MERRIVNSPIEWREGFEGKSGKIVGYGAVFDKRSENLGGFTEVIAPGAFDDVLNQDVRGLFNHDSNFVLGRTISGTMRLSVDDVGLRYEIDAPTTTLVREMVIEPMKRGDISHSSFGFTVSPGGSDWVEDDEGRTIRTVSKVQRLFDVSPVTFPAYPDATSEARAYQDAIEELRGIKEAGKADQDDEKDEVVQYLEKRIAELEASLAGAQRQIEILRKFTA